MPVANGFRDLVVEKDKMYNNRKYSGTLILLSHIFCILFLQKSTTKNPACDVSVSSIAGKYYLAKAEKVAFSSGAATDITSTLSNCELTAEYNFDMNGTATYTEFRFVPAVAAAHGRLKNEI